MTKPGATPPSWEIRFWNASDENSGDTVLASAAAVAKMVATTVDNVGTNVVFIIS